MNDKAHVGFVDAHAERDRRNDDLYIVTDKGFLIFAAVRIFQPGMIGADGIALRREIRGEFIHLLARETINDARLVLVAFQHVDGLLIGILFAGDFDVEILAVETGDEFVGGRELERCANILPDARGGGGSQCQANRVRKSFSHFNDLPVFGTEIVPPFRDTVRFINREAIHLNGIKQGKNAGA